MICPNCKTELVEVNGRYICSDCGREIPENEVMAGDWGDGGTVRAGLYGAGTDAPKDNLVDSPSTDSITSEPGAAPVTVETVEAEGLNTEVAAEPTVEEVLQQQSADIKPVEQPTGEPESDTGFYTAEDSQPVNPSAVQPEVIPVIPTPVSEGSLDPVRDDNEVTSGSVVVPEVTVEPAPDEPIAQEIPVTAPVEPAPVESAPVEPVAPAIPTPSPVIPTEAEESPSTLEVPTEPVPEAAPEHSELVKDMFADSEAATANSNTDPGIYTDPMYEASADIPQATNVSAGAPAGQPMAAEKRLNLIILIGGSVLVLLLLVGGIWGYVALSQKVKVEPVVTNQEVAWQELQVIDGGFKISFPGTPQKTNEKLQINGLETDGFSNVYTNDDITYSLKYAFLGIPEAKSLSTDLSAKFPALLKEIADPLNLTVANSKIGKYYLADAVDFTLTSDTASYQGKLMVSGNKYILVIAGSSSGQNVDYSKFIKSFSFITTGSSN